jgi:hypothetical protein
MAERLGTQLQSGGLEQSIHTGLLGSGLFGGASLDLNFAVTKNVGPLVSFTRASSGTFTGSDGVLRTATTNLVPGSADFSATYTSLNNVAISTDAATAPNGSITADTITGASSALNVKYFYKSFATNTTGVYTASVYLKANTQSIVLLRLNDNTGNNGARQLINLSTGQLSGSVVADGTATGPSSSITAVGDGWYRCTVTCTFNSAITGLQGPAVFHDGYTTSTSTNSYFVWGAQLEQSSTVGEYIPTISTINSAPRFDHNPTTGESLGLLVEEQRTNLVTYSEQLDDVIWGPVAGTVTANAETSPANTLTADKLIATNGGPQGQLAQGVTITSGATVTGSVYAKAGGFDRVELVLLASNNTTPYGRSTFNPNTGVITTAAFTSNGGTNASSAVQALTNGWYRFSVTVTYPAVTSAGVRFAVFNSDSANGDGVKGVFLWGAQLEAGAFPTSYIPTTTAAATRSADVASITGSAFSSWYNATEGTIYHQGATPTAANFFSIDDATTNNRITSFMTSATAPAFFVATGGATQANISSSAITAGSTFAQANSYKANDFVIVTNGGTVSTDISGSVPTVNKMVIGANIGGAAVVNGTIRRLTYWPTRLPNSTLQAVTQ